MIAAVGRDAGQVLSEIRSLVEAGLQLDEVPGRPDDPSALVINGHRLVRRYTRGTPDYESALRQGMLERLPHTPPASTSAVEQAEELVGATLPGLLKNIFLDIANGGFGPAYGVLGVEHGFRDDLQRTAVDILKRRDEWLGMPDNLLPLCSWGCAIYSFVHCPSGRIFGWDPNPVETEDDVPFFEQEYTLETWLDAWLDGSLRQPMLVVDLVTQQYRGATIEESAAFEIDGADDR